MDHLTGVISLIASQPGTPLGSGPEPITVDSAGDVYVATQTAVIRIDALSHQVTTVVGGGSGQSGGGPWGDGGAATAAQVGPAGIAIDRTGNLYIADSGHARIRRVDAATGIITTVAGNGTSDQQYFSGLTGPAQQISIGIPTGIAVAPDGDVYWTAPGWVLKVNTEGLLSIVAGNEAQPCVYAGDGGPAQWATVCSATALAFDGSGNLFVAEGTCGCVRRVETDTGIIQTVAGTGTPGTGNDGPAATQVALTPGGIALSGGTLYIADVQFAMPARVRAVTPATAPSLPQPPSITWVGDAVDYHTYFSPGAIVSLFGNYLAPPLSLSGRREPGRIQAISKTCANAGRLEGCRFPTTEDGDQVRFNGTPAPLLSVTPGQINTVMPYSTDSGNAEVQVSTGAGVDTLGSLFVSPTSLSLYSGLVWNPDGTLNSAANPAPKGATLVMFGTGMGQTSPAGVDGTIVPGPPLPIPVAPFAAVVTRGTTQYPATVSYLGPRVGFVAGAVQAEVRIPDSVPAGQANLYVYVQSAGPNGFGAPTQTIYLLSDPPILTGISPASPIPQSVGVGIYLTLTGANLTGIGTFNFLLNGQPVNVQPQIFQPCTPTSCTVFVYFAGMAGQYSVTAVNAANQASNQFMFSVQPYAAPTVTGVDNFSGSGPVVATKGGQFVSILGTGFLAPETANLYFNGAKIATFNSSSSIPLQIYSPQVIQIYFDFQGNAGQYAIEAIGTNGSSGLFSFTVATP